jgi:hypothetical protein
MMRGWATCLVLVAACQTQPPKPASAQKIGDAEGAGEIDHDTALLYYLYVCFAPDKLPAQYHGDDSHAVLHASEVMAEIGGRFDQMSPDLQAQIQPFLIRPDDPTSFWHQAVQALTTQSLQTASDPPPDVPFASLTDSGNQFRIHYPVYPDNDFSGVAAQLAQDLAQYGVWNTYQRVMLGRVPASEEGLTNYGGDYLLDFYFIPPGVSYFHRGGATAPTWSGNEGGLTIPEHIAGRAGCPCPAYILLFLPTQASQVNIPDVKGVMVHETFHAFQTGFASNGDNDHGYGWWRESTAKWAEDLIYPTTNREWRSLPAGIWNRRQSPINGPLDKFIYLDPAQYSTYLWSFYLTRKAHYGETVIGEIFQASEQVSPLSANALRASWAGDFKDFALTNWNRDPVVRYDDSGVPIPRKAILESEFGMEIVLDQDSRPTTLDAKQARQLDFNVNLAHTSVEYYEAQISDGNGPVHKVSFDLSAVRSQPGAGVQAIVSFASGLQQTQDWSDSDEKHFCRDLDAEKITDVVLVVSNSDQVATLQGPIVVTAKPSCQQMTGSFTYDATSLRTLTPLTASPVDPSGTSNSSISIKSIWNLDFLSSAGGVDTYKLTSDNTIVFSSMSTATVNAPPEEVLTEVDNVSGNGRTHDPAILQTDPMTGADVYDPFDYPQYKSSQSTLAVDGNQWHLNWVMSRIHTTRDFSYNLMTLDVDQTSGMPCTKTETASYDASLPGFSGTVSSCNGDTPHVIADSDGPPHVCGPTITSMDGTFDPKSGVIAVDVSMDDASCPSGLAGNCFDPYSPTGTWGDSGTCANHVHYTVNVQVPPR